jgi:hypothetical protein
MIKNAVIGLVVVAGVLALAGGINGCKKEAEESVKIAAPSPPVVVNATCPMMGTVIDPANVPDSLIREFEGKKVGFCCAGCPAAWDKLEGEAKRQKLALAKLAKPAG